MTPPADQCLRALLMDELLSIALVEYKDLPAEEKLPRVQAIRAILEFASPAELASSPDPFIEWETP